MRTLSHFLGLSEGGIRYYIHRPTAGFSRLAQENPAWHDFLVEFLELEEYFPRALRPPRGYRYLPVWRNEPPTRNSAAPLLLRGAPLAAVVNKYLIEPLPRMRNYPPGTYVGFGPDRDHVLFMDVMTKLRQLPYPAWARVIGEITAFERKR